ncbi:MAG: carotenoid oxygenase family protein [Mycobacterium sp.]|nr:carotenoid oxygenase family protein [Mycobacterium sp.]
MSHDSVTAAALRPSVNPFLAGNYAPVQHENTSFDLDVTGVVPEYLDGRYLRTGPNPLVVTDPEKYHWFVGEGMVHGLRLRDGRAHWYRNRWVRSTGVARALGERPPGRRRDSGFDFAANTNVIGHAGRTLVLNEMGVRPYALDDELNTLGGEDFCETLFGGYSAHPKRDPATAELHAVSYNPVRGNIVRYSVTDVGGRVRRTVDIALPAHTMMHDLSLTERHVVIYDLPVVLDLSSRFSSAPARTVARAVTRFAATHAAPDFLLRTIMRASEHTSGSFGMPYRWDPDKPARIGVLPREGIARDIRWFEVPQCYVFHTLNAYDEQDRIVLDVVRHPSVFAGGTQGFEPTTLDRWTVDLDGGRVYEQRLDDTPQEFPRVDERVVSHRHRYGYAVASTAADGNTAPSAILRHDLVDGHTRRVEFGAGREPGEFVFVPSSPTAGEDDGVAMGFVYDRATDRSDLVLLDAQTLQTVGSVHLPVRVPHGFHGNWVA